jgi:hypothetical protein
MVIWLHQWLIPFCGAPTWPSMVEYQSIKLISQWLIPNFDLTVAFGGATMEWLPVDYQSLTKTTY